MLGTPCTARYNFYTNRRVSDGAVFGDTWGTVDSGRWKIGPMPIPGAAVAATEASALTAACCAANVVVAGTGTVVIPVGAPLNRRPPGKTVVLRLFFLVSPVRR